MRKRWKISIATLVLVGLGGAVFSFTGCSILGCKQQITRIVIDSFQECVDAGHAVLPTDPPKCIVDKDHVFTQKPVFLQIESPKPFDVVNSPLEVIGQARALNNTVYYRLQSNDDQLISEGSFSGNSPEHGRWGQISAQILFDPPAIPSGKLYLFEENQNWNDEDVLSIPLNFTVEGNFETEREENTISEFDPLLELTDVQIPQQVTLNVPFTPQAPFADWNPPYDEACEESSLIMVEYYLRDEPLNPTRADSEIVLQYNWQTERGYEIDIDTNDLANVARDYYQRKAKRYTDEEVSIENIKRLLAGGYPVIIPAAGQLLGNPNFRGAGPPYHMLVITGYDENGFITNDPGTRNGEDFRYSYDTIMNVIHDWNGSKETIQQGPRAILVIGA